MTLFSQKNCRKQNGKERFHNWFLFDRKTLYLSIVAMRKAFFPDGTAFFVKTQDFHHFSSLTSLSQLYLLSLFFSPSPSVVPSLFSLRFVVVVFVSVLCCHCCCCCCWCCVAALGDGPARMHVFFLVSYDRS